MITLPITIILYQKINFQKCYDDASTFGIQHQHVGMIGNPKYFGRYPDTNTIQSIHWSFCNWVIE